MEIISVRAEAPDPVSRGAAAVWSVLLWGVMMGRGGKDTVATHSCDTESELLPGLGLLLMLLLLVVVLLFLAVFLPLFFVRKESQEVGCIAVNCDCAVVCLGDALGWLETRDATKKHHSSLN
jgi:hypothetical protein